MSSCFLSPPPRSTPAPQCDPSPQISPPPTPTGTRLASHSQKTDWVSPSPLSDKNPKHPGAEQGFTPSPLVFDPEAQTEGRFRRIESRIEHARLPLHHPRLQSPLRHPHPPLAQNHVRLRLARLLPRRPSPQLDRIPHPQNPHLPRHLPPRNRPPRHRLPHLPQTLRRRIPRLAMGPLPNAPLGNRSRPKSPPPRQPLHA